MSCHRLPILGEILQGDLVGKIRKLIGLKYFLNCECNCTSKTMVKFTCAYRGECRIFIYFYKVTCRQSLSFYVVNTQNTFKKRMEQLFQDVDKKLQNDKNSDTFAAHFAQHFNQKMTPQQYREIMKFQIISQVNPIRSMKTWSNSSCTLCME